MWITRDESAERCRLFVHKPKRYEQLGIWIDDKESAIEYGLLLDSDMYPDVKWEDEPVEVALIPQTAVDNFIQINEKEIEEYRQEVIEFDRQIRAEGIY